MKAAVMQPYFFPYLGYFSLIKHTDRFVLLDTVQFYRGWLARNRILKPGDGWQYIVVPLSAHSRNARISDLKISYHDNWMQKILAQLQHYKKLAPYFDDVLALVRHVFSVKHESLTTLNQAAMNAVLEYLCIERKIEILSEMKLDVKPHNSADECCLRVCEALGNVSEYWNPPGGKHFYDKGKYFDQGITLRFHEVILSPYSQRRETFEPGLSILDVLMFNSVNDVNNMLDSFTLS